MITLTAKMRIQGENPLPFTLGVSQLGGSALFGTTIDEEVKFDRRNLLSLESEVKDRADINQPSFGIISTGGSMSFKDNSGRFLNYANAGLLTEGIEITILLENTVKKVKKQVGCYYTTDWEYDNNNRSVTVSLKDNLEDWQNILTNGFPIRASMTMKELYDWLVSNSEGYYFSDLNQETLQILEKTQCLYPYLEQGSLWSQWKKLCDICALQIYKYNNQVFVNHTG